MGAIHKFTAWFCGHLRVGQQTVAGDSAIDIFVAFDLYALPICVVINNDTGVAQLISWRASNDPNEP